MMAVLDELGAAMHQKIEKPKMLDHII